MGCLTGDLIKTTEFILQMDEFYGIKLCSVKLFLKKKKKKAERHPTHKELPSNGFSVKGAQADSTTSIQVQL